MAVSLLRASPAGAGGLLSQPHERLGSDHGAQHVADGRPRPSAIHRRRFSLPHRRALRAEQQPHRRLSAQLHAEPGLGGRAGDHQVRRGRDLLRGLCERSVCGLQQGQPPDRRVRHQRLCPNRREPAVGAGDAVGGLHLHRRSGHVVDGGDLPRRLPGGQDSRPCTGLLHPDSAGRRQPERHPELRHRA
ncbi:hypothetical protein D3C72_1391380 [compost metagenome]